MAYKGVVDKTLLMRNVLIDGQEVLLTPPARGHPPVVEVTTSFRPQNGTDSCWGLKRLAVKPFYDPCHDNASHNSGNDV